MIITIDGPAGSGKSTVSKRLAEHLKFQFLDTGAMYRSVAFVAVDKGIPLDDHEAIAEVARTIRIQFDDDLVCVNDGNVSVQIRTPAVTQAASIVAAIPDVRRHMVSLQRRAAEGLDIVSEGRDQGTVVFPDADYKFFLTANLHARATRRQKELASRNIDAAFEDVVDQICERDRRDENRDIAPMRPADDAVTIDTSAMSLDAVLSRLIEAVATALPSSDKPSTTNADHA